MTDLEKVEQELINELKEYHYTRYDLLGNAACARKIRNVITAHILIKHTQGECEEAMKTLMIGSLVTEKDFKSVIVPYIDVYYKAKELIDKGYCNDLIK